MTNDNGDENVDGWVTVSVKLPKEEKEQWQENSDSMSGRLRRIVKEWNKAEREFDLRDDFENLNYIVLNTYKNAIEKNISTLKAQRDKLEEEIEKIDQGEQEEVLFEVKLELEGENL